MPADPPAADWPAADWPAPRSRTFVGRGARHTEALLLAALDADLDRLGRSLLAHPVLLVVPSQSLRQHLLTRLAARRPAIAGLWCRTLYGLATELMRLAGLGLPGELDPLMLVARRLARDEPALARSFEHLVDGYRSGAASVSDLMDAGFDPAHAEALDEVLASDGPEVAGRQSLERARAVIRVAARCAAELDRRGLSRRPAVLLRAAELVRGGAPAPFAPAAVHIYGFADATGVATDLLEALLDRHPATLYLDRPADPAEPGGEPAGARFGRRFRERLIDRAPIAQPEADATPPPPAELTAFRALGGAAEAREVARRLRALLDGGARPERIGVVGRRLEGYLSALRVQCRRYGVPFSGLAARGPVTPRGRVVGAVLDLLLLGRRAPVERWLDARQRGFGKTPSFDLRLACHSLGAARLEDLPGLPLGKLIQGSRVPLPVRLGFDSVERPADDDDGGPSDGPVKAASLDEGPEESDGDEGGRERNVLLRRRSVAAATVRKAAQAAAGLCKRFDKWPKKAPLRRHFELLRALLRDGLDWAPDHPLTLEIESRLDSGGRGLETLELSREELHLVLRDLLANVGRERLGGEGAGVQILDATEARGRTFDHLFLLGLNGGVFPRTVREDPLLGDPLRRRLARQGFGVLPDLPLKRDGAEEERYLFAQLLSAAPAVTLSWQQVDDDNGARTVSPLVERLRWSAASPFGVDPPLARPAHSPRPAEAAGARAGGDAAPTPVPVPRPLLERAVEAALGGGDRQALAPILALGLGDLPAPRETAAARLRILEEMDPPPSRAPGLGPYLGVVGPPLGDDDPRNDRTLFVTTLERMCGCPWQTLLTRLLRIEPLPDPLETLPAINPLLIGNVVHRAAEAVVERRLGRAGDAKLPPRGRLALPVSWPDEDELERIVLDAAGGALRDSGVGLPGFDRVVALAVRPYLEELRRLDWPGDARVPVLGGEVRDNLDLPPGPPPRQLAFRADRVDGAAGRLVYTDYKTGRSSISAAASEKKRRQATLEQVRSGLRLQVPAYAIAGGGSGRYLFLHPDLDGVRTIAIDGDDAEIAAAFDAAVAAALDAWRQGAFPPRVVEPDRNREPKACRWCEVAQACVRGDSGARRRLREWAEAEPGDAPGPVVAARTVWRLPLPEGKR